MNITDSYPCVTKTPTSILTFKCSSGNQMDVVKQKSSNPHKSNIFQCNFNIKASSVVTRGRGLTKPQTGDKEQNQKPNNYTD